MPRTRPAYPVEFRQQMVELVRAGRDPTDLARAFLMREGSSLEFYAAVSDTPFTPGAMANPNAKLGSKRVAVRTAILLAGLV